MNYRAETITFDAVSARVCTHAAPISRSDVAEAVRSLAVSKADCSQCKLVFGQFRQGAEHILEQLVRHSARRETRLPIVFLGRELFPFPGPIENPSVAIWSLDIGQALKKLVVVVHVPFHPVPPILAGPQA